jgi:hypothetical protein
MLALVQHQSADNYRKRLSPNNPPGLKKDRLGTRNVNGRNTRLP